MNRRNRGAFTLVELLVVITIISMLIALLLPAVQSARESGRRAQCMNNQKQLTLASIAYESTHGHFPGYLNRVGSGTGQYASWMVMLLPHMERNDLWEIWREANATLGTVGVTMQSAMCPSDVNAENGLDTSYAVNVGTLDHGLYTDTAAHGVFHDLAPFAGKPDLRVSSTYISVNDGTPYTILLSENVQANNYVAFGSGGAPAESSNAAVTPENEMGIAWRPLGTASAGCTGAVPTNINDCFRDGFPYPAPGSGSVAHNAVTRPSSYHPGGVIMSFADGHSAFVRETVDYNVVRHMMTPNGQAAGLSSLAPFDEGDL